MHYKIISKNTIVEELLPMEEVMSFLRVYDYQEESLLSILREAAVDFTENYTNRLFGSGLVVGTFKYFKQEVMLPFNPSAIVEIKAYNQANEEVVISNYRFNKISGTLTFLDDYSQMNDFEVYYNTDYSESNTPHALKVGMLKLIATWYENREDISNGVSVQEIPMNHRRVFDLYRLSPTGG